MSHKASLKDSRIHIQHKDVEGNESAKKEKVEDSS